MVSRTTIVNVKHKKCDVYCGRPHFLGNPFQVGRDGTRDDVIEKYEEWFKKKLTEKYFRDKVLSLKGKVLGCWCVPLRCHLEVVVNYLDQYE
jgi:hypothetical protein